MLLVTIAAFIYAIMPMTSLAYVQNSTNVDEEGYWEVTNADSDSKRIKLQNSSYTDHLYRSYWRNVYSLADREERKRCMK